MDKSREAYEALRLREILTERKRLMNEGERCAEELTPMPYDEFLKDYLQGCVSRGIAKLDSCGNVTWQEGWPAFITKFVEERVDGGVWQRVQLNYEPLESPET